MQDSCRDSRTRGSSGPIYCTKPTGPMARLVLEDSAELQEEQARYARKKGYSRHRDPEPLYTAGGRQARPRALPDRALRRRARHLPGDPRRLPPRRPPARRGVARDPRQRRQRRAKTWCFSGDIGRYGVPILVDPQPPRATPDALVLESTYGDRAHAPGNPTNELRTLLERAFSRGGVAVIPAFALGRSQDVLYHLRRTAPRGFPAR